MAKLKDDSLMPYGKYSGRQMADVPANYLLYLYDEKICYGSVKEYIFDNLDVLRLEVKKSQKKQNDF